jgi:hypothetical protein
VTEINFVVTANPTAIFLTLGIIHIILMIFLIAAIRDKNHERQR